MKLISTQAGLLALVILAAACSKKDDPVNPVATTGSVSLRFAARAGAQPLALNTGSYTTADGASIKISTFKYFVSNVQLTSAVSYNEKESYHLVSAGDAGGATTFSMADVPAGSYTGVRFLVGVDSTRNVSGAQTGDLDPTGRAEGMFWTWNTGYIMAKLEGTSPQSGDATNQRLTYHIGGFSGANSGLRTVTLAFPQPLVVKAGAASAAYLSADAMKWFGPSNPIDVRTLFFTMSVNATSAQIADNYAAMFTADSVRN